MLESIMLYIKSLPAWLGAVVEVMIVAVAFMTAITFIAGMWCGLKIVGKRADSIKQIQLFPLKIIFYEDKQD